MTTSYFDANAFVKLLIEEVGSSLAEALWDASTEVISSVLAYPEVRAALSAAHRAGRIDSEQLDQVEDEWEAYWSGVRPVDLSDLIARIAAQECRTHGLGGADGVHLASALVAVEAGVLVVTWNRRLSAGSRAAGLLVAP
jgi:uncharacterized protein